MAVLPKIKISGSYQDVSNRALAIARAVDRLPVGGQYIVDIVKSDIEAEAWKVFISEVVILQRMTVSKYIPE